VVIFPVTLNILFYHVFVARKACPSRLPLMLGIYFWPMPVGKLQKHCWPQKLPEHFQPQAKHKTEKNHYALKHPSIGLAVLVVVFIIVVATRPADFRVTPDGHHLRSRGGCVRNRWTISTSGRRGILGGNSIPRAK